MIKAQQSKFPGEEGSIWMPQIISLSITTFLLSPFERSQSLLQIRDTYINPESPKNIKQFAKNIYYNQGTTSMWRGAFQNFIRQFAQFNLAYFFSDKIYKYYLAKETNGKSPHNHPYFFYLMNNYFCNIITYPLQVVKTKYMVNTREKYADKPYQGINSCLKQSYKIQGIKGIFGGFSIATLHLALSFLMMQTFISLTKEYQEVQDSVKLLGGLAAIQTILYPLDTIKKRLQVSGALQHNQKYNSLKKAITTSPSKLYSGLIFRMVYMPLHVTTFGMIMKKFYETKAPIIVPQQVLSQYKQMYGH